MSCSILLYTDVRMEKSGVCFPLAKRVYNKGGAADFFNL